MNLTTESLSIETAMNSNNNTFLSIYPMQHPFPPPMYIVSPNTKQEKKKKTEIIPNKVR